MYQHIRNLLDDLSKQSNLVETVINHRHVHLMSKLTAVEKEILAKSCLEWNWNVGSTTVLKALQAANILNMTDYMLYVFNQDVEDAQLVLSELLEKEFVLLADLLKHTDKTNGTSEAVNDILAEGFKRLCNDVIENPSVLVSNYLIKVETFVQDDCLKGIRLMHLKLLLQESPKCPIEEAIANQHRWNDEFDACDRHCETFKSFLVSIIGGDCRSRYETFAAILDKCNDNQMACWKYSLRLLSATLDSRVLNKQNWHNHADFRSAAKRFTKNMFRAFTESKNEKWLLTMFLIARQICQCNEAVMESYHSWFKDTIGGVHYLIKNNEFITVMEILTKMIQFESDPNILNVHINTYIPPPPRCNQIILNYKELCRSKLLHVNQSAMAETDVFLIDDD